MKRNIQEIQISNLKLDLENVRFGQDTASSQHEAIALMMSSDIEARKILKLAEHISTYGLDPTELQLVYQDVDKKYIVIEGNRRLTALKLIFTPDACPIDKMVRDFRKVHENTNLDSISSIDCGVVNSREDAQSGWN